MKVNKLPSSWRRIRTITAKELIDFIRDWRTLVAIVLIPLLLFPFIFVALPLVLESEMAERESTTLRIAIQSESAQIPIDLENGFEESLLNYTIENLENELLGNLSEPGNDIERIRNASVSAVLRINSVESNNTTMWHYAIIHDSTSESSTEAYSRVNDILSHWEVKLVETALVDAGLDPESTLEPLIWNGTKSDSDVATVGEQAGFVFSLFIPMIVAIWTATSAIQPSIDMTAGERERGTLEALLTAPCSRFELLIGKWLSVSIIAATGVFLQILGLLFAVTFLLSGTATLFQIPDISISALLLMIFGILLFATMVVAFEIAIAVRSRSVKEAGSILGPIILIFVFPAMLAQFVNLEGIENYWFCIPVVNILLAMRELFLGKVIITHVLLWSVSSLAYALLAAWYASRQFNREDLVESIS